MTYFSPDEARRELIAKLGEETGILIDNLRNDIAVLHINWRTYRSFFGTDPFRVNLFNSISGPTAHLLERALWHEAVISVCRLTDKSADHSGNLNITVKRLQEVTPSDHQERMKSLIADADKSSKFARKLRDKHIAHSDDGTRNHKADPVSRGSREMVQRAIDSIDSCLLYFYEVGLRAYRV